MYIYIYIYGSRYTYIQLYIYIYIHILPESGRLLPKLTNSDWRPFSVAPRFNPLEDRTALWNALSAPAFGGCVQEKLGSDGKGKDEVELNNIYSLSHSAKASGVGTLSMQMGSISIFMGGIKHQFILVIYLLWGIVSLCIVSCFDGGWGWSWWLWKQSLGKQKERALWPYVSHTYTVLIIFVPSQKWPCQWTILDDFDENPQQFIWNVPAKRRLIAGLNAFRDFLTGGLSKTGRMAGGWPWQVWGHGAMGPWGHGAMGPWHWAPDGTSFFMAMWMVKSNDRLRTGSRFPCKVQYDGNDLLMGCK